MRGVKEHFGSYLKSLRLRAGFGLRRFASLIEMKASNLCDIEHKRRAMPKEYLEPVADALGLEQASAGWEKFFELARKDNELPADLKKVTQRKLVPTLLRTIDNVQLSDKEIKQLIEDIQGRRTTKNEPS